MRQVCGLDVHKDTALKNKKKEIFFQKRNYHHICIRQAWPLFRALPALERAVCLSFQRLKTTASGRIKGVFNLFLLIFRCLFGFTPRRCHSEGQVVFFFVFFVFRDILP